MKTTRDINERNKWVYKVRGYSQMQYRLARELNIPNPEKTKEQIFAIANMLIEAYDNREKYTF